MVKLLLLDKWLEAIGTLIRMYDRGKSPAYIDCPLCVVHRQEIRKQEKPDNCCCPWKVFEFLDSDDSCYIRALRQSQKERIARLKDWRRRILRMKRRRKK